MTQATYTTICKIIVLVTPLVIGVIIAAINNQWLNGTIEKVEPWVRRRQQSAAQKRGWFSKFVTHPPLWTITKFCDWTDGVAHRGLRSGLRVTATLYAIAAWLFVLYVAFIVVVVILVLFVCLLVLGLILKLKEGTSPGRASSDDTRRAMHDGRSEEKETFLGGKYTQYYDKEGDAVATEEVKERLLGGQYVQCYDKDGNEIGTKELKETLFGGTYVQQYDEEGNKVGTATFSWL